MCDSSPCQHGAECTNTGVNSFECNCLPGWQGDYCQTRKDNCEGTCKNDAQCYSLSEGTYCRCKEGTAGDRCEIKSDVCDLFDSFLCVNGRCENQEDGSARCNCDGEITSCAIEENRMVLFTFNTLELIPLGTVEECKQRCVDMDSCQSLVYDSGACSLYGEIVLADSEGAYLFAGVKKCRFDPYYSGKSCQLVKEMCRQNPCGIDDDNMGTCSIQGLKYSCDCSKVDNYEGDRCDILTPVCHQSTCPSGVQCHPYMDHHGKRSPACLCQANEILAGATCKKLSHDFDLLFPPDTEDDDYVTSVQGFLTGDKGDITIAMWVACLEEPEDWILSIAESDQDPSSHHYKSLIEIYDDEIRVRNELVDLEGDLSSGYSWHFLAVSFHHEGKYQIVYDFNTYDFETETHQPLNFTVPKNRYMFVHLGKGFSGYISQVHVWNSVVDLGDLLGILTDSLYVPDSSSLALQWSMYNHDVKITPVRPSTAEYGTSACALPTTVVAKVEHCRDSDDVITDKKSPMVRGRCEKAVTLRPYNDSNQVTLGMLNINFEDGVISTNVPANALTFGAHDVAVASTDLEGNVGMCMTRVYVTDEMCEVPIETESIEGSPINRQSTCYKEDKEASIPIPKVFSCGKLRSFDLDDMFRRHYKIPCGEEDDLYVTLETDLVYALGTSCFLIDVEQQFLDEVSRDIQAIFDDGWGICAPNCSVVEVSAICNPSNARQMLINIVMRDLLADLENEVDGVTVTKSPEELMRYLVDEDEFNAESIANARTEKDMAVYNSTLLCRFGYGRMGDACVECGPGSYYVHNAVQKCTLCPLGTYTKHAKMTACTPCQIGQTTLQRGSNSEEDCVDKCSVGSRFDNSSMSCQPCPPSFYQDEEGQGVCKPCPPATGADGEGADSIEDCQEFCPPGLELIGLVCMECQRGFYRIGNLQDRCKKCPDNYTTLAEASSDWSQCDVPECSPGSRVVDGPPMKCEPCDYGTFQPHVAVFKCEPCPPSYTTNHTRATNQSDCIFVCPPGQEQDGPTSCRKCPRGTFKGDSLPERFEMCSPCPDQDFTTEGPAAVNASQCAVRRCGPGTYYNVTDNWCYECPRGTYQDQDQQDQCETCEDDYSTRNTSAVSEDECEFVCPEGNEVDSTGFGCQVCPRGSYKSEDMMFESCKLCDNGKTTVGNGGTSLEDCKVAKCPSGTTVSNDLMSCIPCEMDTYQPDDEPLTTTVCTRCRGDTGTNHTGADSIDDCLKICQAGQGKVGTDQCTICPRGSWNNGNESMRFEECSQCPLGSTTEMADGADDLEDCSIPKCEAGQIIQDGECEDCPYDSYQQSDEPFLSTSCSPCQPQTGTEFTGADSSGDCRRTCVAGNGWDSDQQLCRLCVRGTWNNGNITMRFQECAPCPDGYTTELESGATSLADCTLRDCKPGSFFDPNNADACTECPIGTYQSLPRQDSCEDCPANKNTSYTGSTRSEDCLVYCLAGKEDDGTETCVLCQDDFFKEEDSFSECRQCQGDLTSTPANRKSCTEMFCDVGRFKDGDSCQDCDQGFYKNMRGNQMCTPCPGNTTTFSTGATEEMSCSLTFCEAGFFSPDDEVCLPCDVGYYKETRGNDVCDRCEGENTTATIATTRKADCDLPICPMGEYRTSSKQCQKCAIGKYQPDEGMTSCLDCDDDYTTLEEGSTHQDQCRRICPVGQYRNESTNRCFNCGLGFYQASEGRTDCDQCPGNYTTFVEDASSDEECHVVCPVGYSRGARTQCIMCPVGKFQNETGQVGCHPCPKVNEYPSTTLQEASTNVGQCLPMCSQGLYLELAQRVCGDCPIGTYSESVGLDTECLPCEDGTTTLSNQSKSESDCHYALCGKGYYRKLDQQECQKCDYGTFQPDNDVQVTSCETCDSGKTTLIQGATDDGYCVEDCDAGYEWDQVSQTCNPCPVGMYRNKPELRRCYYCPERETTLSTGSRKCLTTEVTLPPPVNTIFRLTMFFGVSDCTNEGHIHSIIRRVLIAIFRGLALRYEGLCQSEDCNNLVITFVGVCGPRVARRRRRRTPGEVETQLTLSNVDSRLKDKTAGLQMDAETVIQDGLRDMTSQTEELETNGLTPPTDITLGFACSPGSRLGKDNRTCTRCRKGTFHDTTADTCVEVPKGTYTDKEGSTQPILCPQGMTTFSVGTNSSDKCNGPCAFNTSYCDSDKGSCQPDKEGKSYCQCNDHYKGERCQTYVGVDRSNKDSEYLIGGIAGGIGGLLFLILLVVACFVHMSRSRRSSKHRSDTTDSESFQELKSHYGNSMVAYKPPYFMNPLFSSGSPQPVYVQDPTMYHTNQLDYYHPVYHNNGQGHGQDTSG